MEVDFIKTDRRTFKLGWQIYFAFHLAAVAYWVLTMRITLFGDFPDSKIMANLFGYGFLAMVPGLFVTPFLTWGMRVASYKEPSLALISAIDLGLNFCQLACVLIVAGSGGFNC